MAQKCFKHAQSFSCHRFFEDIELQKDKDSKYRFKKDGKKHTLIIQEATLDDIGMYHAWTNGGHTKGELEVEGTTRMYSPIIFLFCCFCLLKSPLIKSMMFSCAFQMVHLEKQLEVLQDIADLTVKATDQALFKCEVSDDKVTGKWFKDGVEVLPSNRIKMTHIGRCSL